MPLGSFRINSIAKRFAVTVVAEVIRAKKGISAVGNAQVDTAQSKFGGASALFDGTADYLKIDASNASDLNFGTNNFTVEFWLRASAFDFDRYVIGSSTGSFGAGTLGIGTRSNTTSNALRFYVNDAGGDIVTDPTGLSTNTWYHIALVRNGNTFSLFRDGVSVASNTYTGSINFGNTGGLVIGQAAWVLSGSYGIAGHYDEIRVSNTARYTANFIVPSEPHVNDESTLLLLHADGTDASTFFEDDNGIRAKKGIVAVGDAQVDTAQSQFGGASALFDGTGDYLSLESPDFAFGTGDFTIECWARATGSVNNDGIFQLSATGFRGANTDTLAVAFNSGGASKWQLYANNSQRATAAPITPQVDTWYHVAVVRNSGTTKLYVNGAEQHSLSDTKDYSMTTKLVIGGYFSTSFLMAGNVDEFRISNTARYTANFTAPTAPFQNDDNTLLLLHMDGTDASTVFTDDNGVRSPKGITAVGNAQVDTAQSKFGGASALFDGTGDKLEIPYSDELAFGANNFTVEYWLRINAHAGTYTNSIGIWRDDASSVGSVWYASPNAFNGTQKMGFQYIYGTGTDSGAIAFGSALSTGVWQHHAFVRNGNTLTAYLDGVSQGTHDMTGRTLKIGGLSSSTGTTLKIGGMNSGGFVNGHMDEVRVSNTARYTANFTPSTTPFQNDSNTLLLLHMDGTDASTVFTDDNGVISTYEYPLVAAPDYAIPQGAFTSDANTRVLLKFDNNVTDTTGNYTFTNSNLTFSSSNFRVGTHSAVSAASTSVVRFTRSSTNVPSITAQNATIEGWLYTTSYADQEFSYGNGVPQGISVSAGTDYGWTLGVSNGGFLRTFWFQGGWNAITSTVQVPLNQWNHIVFQHNSTTNETKLGLNGFWVAEGTITGDIGANLFTVGNLRLNTPNNQWDEVRYSTTLRY